MEVCGQEEHHRIAEDTAYTHVERQPSALGRLGSLPLGEPKGDHLMATRPVQASLTPIEAKKPEPLNTDAHLAGEVVEEDRCRLRE